MNIFNSIATGLGAVIVASTVLATNASAAPVKSVLRLVNTTQGSCGAGNGWARVIVMADQAGWVQVAQQRKDGFTPPGTFPVHVKLNPNYKKSGVWKNYKFIGHRTFNPTWNNPKKEKWRIIAISGGVSKASSWAPWNVKC